ncbi:ShlB/FhaC/HecB family hemolysin secretion/activation protein [Paraburkholderia lycopersici]|uniref:ShlB/FhaC/HecB family hemolysin secretion/activation protein n=1 Tax=Paraburkholderia lycopersici TaxID=416944 RepID=UPI001161327B|nr:ShlB/FhaC/HecB family hemolysin secretion/activation protein [Paraburkholderia lycopersici]
MERELDIRPRELQQDAAQAADALARHSGRLLKVNLSAARLQEFGGDNQRLVPVAGQVASGNLDTSQQLIVGGPTSVRAYDINAVSGDSGALFTLAFRHTIGLFSASTTSTTFCTTT